MEHLRLQPTPFARYIAGRIDRFCLIDIGCSGGIDVAWREFGDRLAGFAFDPASAEVERLSAAEPNPALRYVPGFVVGENPRPVCWRLNPSARLSYVRTLARRRGEDYALPEPASPEPVARGSLKAFRRDGASLEGNAWHEMELADDEIFLPAFLEREGVADVDFVKMDVDGPDFEILKSLRAVLDDHQVLGVALEVNFFGSAEPDHHTFHNTDRLMREAGFELFKLSVRTYASAALPLPYLQRPGATVAGRPLQGDAVYVRDFGWRLPGADPNDYPPEKHAKLAAIFALFNLPDQAAEVLIRSRERLAPILDVDHALGLLLLQIGSAADYAEYMARFDAEAPEFFNASSWWSVGP